MGIIGLKEPRRFRPGDLVHFFGVEKLSLHRWVALHEASDPDVVYDVCRDDIGIVITSERVSADYFGERPFLLMGGTVGWFHQTSRIEVFSR